MFGARFGGCATLFEDYLGVILEVVVKDFKGKTIQRVNEQIAKTTRFTELFKIVLGTLFSLFIDGGVVAAQQTNDKYHENHRQYETGVITKKIDKGRIYWGGF